MNNATRSLAPKDVKFNVDSPAALSGRVAARPLCSSVRVLHGGSTTVVSCVLAPHPAGSYTPTLTIFPHGSVKIPSSLAAKMLLRVSPAIDSLSLSSWGSTAGGLSLQLTGRGMVDWSRADAAVSLDGAACAVTSRSPAPWRVVLTHRAGYGFFRSAAEWSTQTQARQSPLPSCDSSQFPGTCSSFPLVSGCSNVAC